MIINESLGGPRGYVAYMQCLNGTDIVAKERFHMPYAPQRILTHEERQYFVCSIHTAVCTGCFVVDFRKVICLVSLSLLGCSIRGLFHQDGKLPIKQSVVEETYQAWIKSITRSFFIPTCFFITNKTFDDSEHPQTGQPPHQFLLAKYLSSLHRDFFVIYCVCFRI